MIIGIMFRIVGCPHLALEYSSHIFASLVTKLGQAVCPSNGSYEFEHGSTEMRMS
jgi:hypothetical protein